MSEPSGRSGVDNLTPFEHALAGAVPADANDSPSLAIIDEMRRLAAGVADAPVSQPRLREFLETGGAVARRQDRRGPWRRNGSTAPDDPDRIAEFGSYRAAGMATGGFVDITPIELTQAGAAAQTAPDQPDQPTTSPATAGAEPSSGRDQARIDGIHAALRDILADRDGAAVVSSTPAEAALQSESQPPSQPQSESQSESEHLPVGPDAVSTAPLDAAVVEAVNGSAARTAELPAEGGVDAPSGGAPENEEAAPAITPTPTPTPTKLFPEVPDAADFRTVDRHRSGGPADETTLAAESPLKAAKQAEADSDDSVLIPAAAGAAGSLLEPEARLSGIPMAGLGPADSMGSIPGRRMGRTTMALVGTAAAAAILAIGGLWWTSGLSGSDETETASADSGREADDGEGLVAGGRSGDDGAAGGAGADEPATSTTRATVTVSTPGRGGTGSDSTDTRTSRSSQTTAGNTDATTTPDQSSATTPAGEDPEAETSAPATTAAPSTTVQTTAATAPPQPVTVHGSVKIGSADGAALGGVSVTLWNDTNNDGAGDQVASSTNTGGDGRFGFQAEAGCFEVRFGAPGGYRIDGDQARRQVCVESGSSSSIDIVAQLLRPDPPSGCHVDRPFSWGHGGFELGVEVFENGGNWADSYTFYGEGGRVVARTRDLGSASEIKGSSTREWYGRWGFTHSDVRSVAAERGGVESNSVGCQRD